MNPGRDDATTPAGYSSAPGSSASGSSGFGSSAPDWSASGGLPPHRADVDDDRDLDEILASLEHDRRTFRAATDLLSSIERVGLSRDGLVAAQVRGVGTATAIMIHPAAMRRHDHVSLAAAVLEALGSAGAAAASAVTGTFPGVVAGLAEPEDGLGGDDPPTATGGEGADADSPAVAAWERRGGE